MKSKDPRNRNSGLALTLFMVLVVIGFGYSILFQAPEKLAQGLDQYRFVFQKDKGLEPQQITIKNRLGQFKFELMAAVEGQGPTWTLVEPRQFPANQAIVENIIQLIQNLKIKRVYEMDAINLANFSLEKDNLSLNILFKDQTQETIQFGLFNSLDQSTYIALPNQKAIFQIESRPLAWESYSLSNFIDLRIFTLAEQDLISFTIYRNEVNANKIRFSMAKKNGEWTETRHNVLLDTKKVTEYIKSLSLLKSRFILDKKSQKAQKQLEKYFEKPSYHVVAKTKQGTLHYTVSNVIGRLDGVSVDRWKNFVIKASNRLHPYVLDKKAYSNFNPRLKDLRRPKIPIKKIFY